MVFIRCYAEIREIYAERHMPCYECAIFSAAAVEMRLYYCCLLLICVKPDIMPHCCCDYMRHNAFLAATPFPSPLPRPPVTAATPSPIPRHRPATAEPFTPLLPPRHLFTPPTTFTPCRFIVISRLRLQRFFITSPFHHHYLPFIAMPSFAVIFHASRLRSIRWRCVSGSQPPAHLHHLRLPPHRLGRDEEVFSLPLRNTSSFAAIVYAVYALLRLPLIASYFAIIYAATPLLLPLFTRHYVTVISPAAAYYAIAGTVICRHSSSRYRHRRHAFIYHVALAPGVI